MELSRENGKKLAENEQVLISQIEQQTALLQDLKMTLSKSIEANVIDRKVVIGESSQVVLELVSDVEAQRLWLSKRQLELAIGVGAFTAGLLSSMLFRA